HDVRTHAVAREPGEDGRELAVQQPCLHARLATEALEVGRDRLVAVDRDHLALAAKPPRKQRRVAARAEGAVDDGLARTRGARGATTWPGRAGLWSASSGNPPGTISRSPFDLALLLPPGRAAPDLEVVVDTDDGALARDPRALDEPARNDQPPLPVEVALRGP